MVLLCNNCVTRYKECLFLYFAFFGILLHAAVIAEPIPPQKQRIFTMNYTPMQGLQVPLVQAYLNKKVFCTFLIDTGSNNNFLTDTLAKQLGLVFQPAMKNGKPFLFNGEPSQTVAAKTCEVGTLTISQMHFIIISQKLLLSTLGQSLIGQQVDGVIGAGDLGLFSVLFDNPNHRIALWYPGKLSEQNILEAGFDPVHGIPLTTPTDDALYSLSAHFRNGQQEGTESLLLDTGGPLTLISASLAQQLKLKPIGKEVSDDLLGGPFLARRAKVSQLEIGPLTLKDVEVEYPSDPRDKKPTILGMGLLSQYRFLIDYASSKVYFAEAAAPTPPASPPTEKDTPK